MRVAVVSPRLPAAAWSITPVVAAIVHGLAKRGHRARLLADSIEDASMFEGVESVSFRLFSQTSTDFPSGLGRWVRDALRSGGHEAVLSLSQRLAGDVLVPLDPSAWAWLVGHVRSKSPLGLAAHLVKHHRAAIALAVSPARRWRRGRGSRAASFGPGRLSRGVRESDAGELELPRFSLLHPADDAERARERGRVRRSLGISAGAPVLVLSAMDSFGRMLDPFLAAIHELAAEMGESGPVVLALARDPFSIARAAGRGARIATGRAPAWLRLLPPTFDIRPALLAADYAVAPIGAPAGNPAAAGALGRFIADALWLGTPVLAGAGAPGADLLRSSSSRAGGPGAIVRTGSRAEWATVLRLALRPVTLAASRREVDRAAIRLDFSGVLDVIEQALHDGRLLSTTR